MHSSGMRTVRSSSRLCSGGGLPGPGGCLFRGVPGLGGVCSWGVPGSGVSAPGGMPGPGGGGIPACTEADPPPCEQNDRQM